MSSHTIAKFIAMFVPAVLAEHVRRRDHLATTDPTQLNTLTDDLYTDVLKEVSTPVAGQNTPVDNSPTHLQNLHYDLTHLCTEFMEDMKDRLRLELLVELRAAMPQHLELAMRQPEHAAAQPAADHSAINIARSVPGMTAPRPVDDTHEMLMATNPLYAKTCRSAERLKKGEAAYSMEEMVEWINRNGEDEDITAQMKESVDKYRPEYDDVEPTTAEWDAEWEKFQSQQ